MVPAVPGVEHQGLVEGGSPLITRMVEGALPLRLVEVVQQRDPAAVQALEQGQRHRDGRGGHVGEFGPGGFLIGLDSGVVLRKGQPEAHVGVQVRVGHVVDNLAARPAAGAVGELQARAARAPGRRRQLGRQLG